jgi:cellulose synthase/poly-beta-1,6-N-acetylglucosamine synthase-like glycosyltransferase
VVAKRWQRKQQSEKDKCGSNGGSPATQNGDYSESASVELSLVVPIHNEGAGLEDFFARVLPVLEKLRSGSEIICVDDGSNDSTLERLLEMHERVPSLKIVSLSRNFGKDIALSAGLRARQWLCRSRYPALCSSNNACAAPSLPERTGPVTLPGV